MPSQQQIEKVEKERDELKKELKLLEKAEDPAKSSEKVYNYVVTSKEPILESPWRDAEGCCIIL